MPRFLFPVDIANRGLDHIGMTPIKESLGFTEASKQAIICGRLYDKLRRAELQRSVWRFAIRQVMLRPVATTTLKLVPSLWSASTTYFPGSIVADQYGTIWVSNSPGNLNNDPLNSSAWEQYFGPLNVSLWDSTGGTSYRASELVYTAAGDGTNRVYMSRLDGNTDTPATATAWSATVTYFKDQVITKSAVAYQSRIDNNLNQDPATTFFAEWAVGTTYGAAAKVTGSDGVLYSSIAGGNIGNDPTTDGGVHWTNTGVLSPWDSTFVGGTGSINWQQIGGAEFPAGVTVAPLNLNYPPGAGPVQQTGTRNVYMVPSGFLRRAPAEPKGVYAAWWPAEHSADDYDFLDRYFTSRNSNVLAFRFVADTVDVTTFDDMFCERLGARIAIEVCEPLSQSTAKKQAAASEYEKFGRDAVAVNAILIGAEEPPMEELVACRL
jgi:hypothetical protein